MSYELRFRQIHLDFHTSEYLEGVGREFDPDEFVRTLKEARVDSVTVFSRCHHGWIHHDTKFPNKHPHLERDLLAEQIRACHAADIRCPIYVTVGWDEWAARNHPEWVEIEESGKRQGRTPLQTTGGWTTMCFASPYIDYVISQVEEVIDRFGDPADGLGIDGFFFDIIHQWGVHSVWCLEEFRRLGLDPANKDDQETLRNELKIRTVNRISDAIRKRLPDCPIFHNGGHVGPVFRRMLAAQSHMEVESLPTGGWGYMHFPMTARYARSLARDLGGLDFLGMTGKFSEMWGHFASYKPVAALEFECLSSVALGGKCSVGDQLPPSGRLDAATYELIGDVYRTVESIEPWCLRARGIAEIAILNAEEFDLSGERMDPRNLGATRMLLEGRHQFDIVDSESDFGRYALLVIPDVVPLTAGPLRDKVEAYVANGGRLVLSGRSAADWQGGAEPLPFSPDFYRPAAGTPGRGDTDYVMYERGYALTPLPGESPLGTITEPPFERSWDRFVSHAHTPPGTPTDRPAALLSDRVVRFAHPVFTTYALHSMLFHRDAVLAAIDQLLPDPLLRADGPRSAQLTLTELPDGRQVLHALHYIPERRGLRLDIVEDRMALGGIEVSVRGTWTVEAIPSGGAIAATVKDGRTHFRLPEASGYAHLQLTPA